MRPAAEADHDDSNSTANTGDRGAARGGQWRTPGPRRCTATTREPGSEPRTVNRRRLRSTSKETGNDEHHTDTEKRKPRKLLDTTSNRILQQCKSWRNEREISAIPCDEFRRTPTGEGDLQKWDSKHRSFDACHHPSVIVIEESNLSSVIFFNFFHRGPLESTPGEVAPKRWPCRAGEESWDERRSGEKRTVAVSGTRRRATPWGQGFLKSNPTEVARRGERWGRLDYLQRDRKYTTFGLYTVKAFPSKTYLSPTVRTQIPSP